MASQRFADERLVTDLGLQSREILSHQARQHLKPHWTLNDMYRVRIACLSGENRYLILETRDVTSPSSSGSVTLGLARARARLGSVPIMLGLGHARARARWCSVMLWSVRATLTLFDCKMASRRRNTYVNSSNLL